MAEQGRSQANGSANPEPPAETPLGAEALRRDPVAIRRLFEGSVKTWGATPRVGFPGGRSVRPAPRP